MKLLIIIGASNIGLLISNLGFQQGYQVKVADNLLLKNIPLIYFNNFRFINNI